ncbi:MAG: hypothetical protein ACJ789_08680 [Thermomicrobiales bacterium]
MKRWQRLAALLTLSTFWPLLIAPIAAAGTANTTVPQEQISTAGRCAGEILNPWSDGGGGTVQQKLSPRGADPRSGHRTWGSAWPYQWSAVGTSSCVNGANAQPTEPVVDKPQQKLIFGDDFEAAAGLKRWHGQRSMTVQSQEVFGGSSAARATTTGAPRVLQERLDSEYPALYYRIRFKIVSLGSNSVNLLRFRSAYNDAILGLYVSAGDRLGLRSDITGDSTSSTTLVTEGEWHEAQIYLHVNGREGQVEVWFDGIRIDSLSSTGWFGNEPIGMIDLGDNTGERAYDVVFDDVAIADSFVFSNATPSPLPGVLIIQTNPKLPGIEIVLDGKEHYVTDAHGIAQLQVARWSSDLRLRITIPEAALPDGRRAKFARWTGWSGKPGGHVYALFDTYVPVTWTFHDLQNQPVDPALVSSITFKGSTGVKHVFKPQDYGKSQYLQSQRIVPTQSGLQPRDLYYSVETAYVGGGNVVIRAKTRFWPSKTQNWEIELLFFSARFRVRDALFGFPSGSTVNLIGPDGTKTVLKLDANHEAYLPKLPRGEYQVSVSGPGFSNSQPVTLSKDQVADLELFSYIDMATIAGVLALIGFGLLYVGRPFLLSPRFWLRWSRITSVWRRVRRASL